ncbi:MAG: hypothetical protein L6R45_24395 [Anaerolineae bacterium]|nr:hypothetical protein [Anaerolineae bacterium]
MSFEQTKLLLLILGLTLISGLADAQGAIHAAKIWQGDKLIWAEVGKAVLGFTIGISTFFIVIKYMNALGIVAPEIQTITWFSMMIVGVALFSGAFFTWRWTEQAVAVGVLAGIGWLLFRTGG